MPAKKQVERILSPQGLADAIQAKGVSIIALAELSGVHRISLHRHLSGKHSLGSGKLKKVWQALIAYKE